MVSQGVKPARTLLRARRWPRLALALGVPGRTVRRFLGSTVFSSLSRRILFLNLIGLGVLVSGILYLNQFRDGLIDARVESLMTQGQIIAGAIAASATVETDSIRIDPEKLLELQAGQSISPRSDSLESLDFPINPERVAPLLRQVLSPTRTRARVYDRDANLILDSRHLYSRGQILRYELPTIETQEEAFFDAAWRRISNWFGRSNLPLYEDLPGGTGTGYSEVMTGLTGGPATVVRKSDKGELIVSVAVPIQRFRAVLGVLQLSTQGGDIDAIVSGERAGIIRIFTVAAAVTILLSLLLASTIANPLRRLSAAAMRVRRSIKAREEIPDFSDRQDEIGDLSAALREMTRALYARIEAIESFAADVAHELKNPLTSLRSAVETLPLAKNDVSRARLMEVIQHDVRRLDRLITDISDASRLDAELARDDTKPLDLEKLLSDIIDLHRNMTRRGPKVEIQLHVERPASGAHPFRISGHDLRLGQVFTNLIDNARSFVPQTGGRIDIRLARAVDRILVRVEDNGPGIRSETIERIFERFYTDRPGAESFGNNSGLGLSISRQIIEGHGGRIRAENIPGPDGNRDQPSGARFVVVLPALGSRTA
jgi:two-component system sensor histidine kinase ChvG